VQDLAEVGAESHDVGWLEVLVDDAVSVELTEPERHAMEHPECPRNVNLPTCFYVLADVSVSELEDQVADPRQRVAAGNVDGTVCQRAHDPAHATLATTQGKIALEVEFPGQVLQRGSSRGSFHGSEEGTAHARRTAGLPAPCPARTATRCTRVSRWPPGVTACRPAEQCH
jgi:hypothetical protein